jgi:hypothetical protein
MDAVCTVQTPTSVRDPGGVTRITWVDKVSDVPCRLTTIAAGGQIVTADQLRNAARWAVTMPLGTDVLEKDRVIVTGTDVAGNDYTLTLDVASKEAPKSFAVHTKVIGVKVSG